MPRHSRPYLQGEHAAVELVELDGEPAAHPGRAPASYPPHAATHGPAAHSVHAFRTPAHGDDSSYDHGSEQLVEPTSVAHLTFTRTLTLTLALTLTLTLTLTQQPHTPLTLTLKPKPGCAACGWSRCRCRPPGWARRPRTIAGMRAALEATSRFGSELMLPRESI